ncbi:MAG: hypothetical protein ACI9MR_001931 [Myxococcota bacterium]|jgi:hypothetical protein
MQSDDSPAYDRAALEAILTDSEAQLEVYIDQEHMSYLPIYLSRANAMHVLGRPPTDVLRQLWLASRCYAAHGAIYLTKWPRHQFRRRRILPLETAIVAGDPDVMERISHTFGLDPMTLLAGMESDGVARELRALTPDFRSQKLEDAGDMAGFLAIGYQMAISSVVAEDPKALEMTKAIIARAVGENPELVTIRRGGLGRMLAIHGGLAAIRPPHAEGVLDALAEHHRLHDTALRAKIADDPALLKTAEGALDTTVLAIMTMALAMGLNLGRVLKRRADNPDLRVALAYGEALGHTAQQ